MRTILFFDLPMLTKKNTRDYVAFLKIIKRMGFVMLQESVYTKLSINQIIVDHTLAQIKKELPPDGFVSVLTITEKQFSSIENLIGDIKTDVVMSDKRVIEL